MKTKPKIKVPVSTRALIARINRKLAHSDEKLCHARAASVQQDFGEYYVVDTMRNFVSLENKDVELVELAEKLGVLKPYERLAED